MELVDAMEVVDVLPYDLLFSGDFVKGAGDAIAHQGVPVWEALSP